MYTKLRDLLSGLSHLFYPRLCEGCSKPLLQQEEVLCIGCALQLPRTEYHNNADNETATRFAGRLPFQHATTFAYFVNDGLLQHLLHGLKYKEKKENGTYLGRQFATDLQQAGWIKEIDGIVPVPLHPKKEASRGYNQTVLVAEGMNDILSIPVWDKALKRLRDTESQTKKTRAERVQNMEEAFAVNQAELLKDKHVLLIDDVLTTGATLEACARALLTIPGIRVSVATIGIAMD